MPVLTKDYIQNSGFTPEEQIQLWKLAQEQAVNDERLNQSEKFDQNSRLGMNLATDTALTLLPVGLAGRAIKSGAGLLSRGLNFGRGLFGRALPTAAKTTAQAAKNARALESGAAVGERLMQDPTVRTVVGGAKLAGRGARAAGRGMARAPVTTALTAAALAPTAGKIYDGVAELFDEQGNPVDPNLPANVGGADPSQVLPQPQMSGEDVTPEMLAAAKAQGGLNLATGVTETDILNQAGRNRGETIDIDPNYREPMGPMADESAGPQMTQEQQLIEALMQSMGSGEEVGAVEPRRPFVARALESVSNFGNRYVGRPTRGQERTQEALQQEELRRSKATPDPVKAALLQYALGNAGTSHAAGLQQQGQQQAAMLQAAIEQMLRGGQNEFISGENELDRANRLEVARQANPFAGMSIQELMQLTRQMGGAGGPQVRRTE